MKLAILLSVMAVSAIALISACTISPYPQPTVCPHLKEWTEDDQGRLADELKALPPGSMIGAAMEDYYLLRAEVRACQP